MLYILAGILLVIVIGYAVGAKLGFYKIDSSIEDERQALEGGKVAASSFFERVRKYLGL